MASRPQRAQAVLDPTDPASPFYYPSSQTAVLLMDYHNFIVGMVQPPEAKEGVISNVKSLLKWARENNILVVHALVDITRSPSESSKAKARWPMYKQIVEQNPVAGDEYHEFASKEEVNVTRRPGLVSAMESDNLRSLLEERGIKSLVMAGLSTSGCTLSTARAAPDQGYVSTVVEDCCWDREGVHDQVVEEILPTNTNVIDTKTLIEEAGKAKH